MFQTSQLAGAILMIIGVLMSIIGGVLTMKDNVCSCPLSPGPFHAVVIPVIDSVLLYLGIFVCIFGTILFVVKYFGKKR
ncbi:MAG: hypothetical protein PXX83_09510 [Candidatus Nitrosotalea sp.]|nr:hypothetical protein [Candidatus Nitrosotalea sp.]